MDIQISYLNAETTYNNITGYEELLQEVQQKFPALKDFEFSYQDEEGDLIQVSNTSDLIAITDISKVVIKMEANLDEEKQKELEKQRKIQELRQRKKEEARQKKLDVITLFSQQIAKEQKEILSLTIEIDQLRETFESEIVSLEQRLAQYANYKPDPLPDFRDSINQSTLFDVIREKEAQLLMLDDKKGFDTQLKTIQKEIHELFHQLYAVRLGQHSENYKKFKETKQQQSRTELQIQQAKDNRDKQVAKLIDRKARHEEKLTQLQEDKEEVVEQQEY